MRLELALSQKLEQRLLLAPQIIQSIEILQLPLLELDRLIRDELEENPVLEVKEVPPEEDGKSGEKDEEAGGAYEILAEMEREGGLGSGGGRGRPASQERDKKMEAMLNTAARPATLQESLFQQFNLLDISDRERDIGEKIIFNLDKNGYLRYALAEILDFEKDGASRLEAEQVLSRVQGLEPKGVGGRDLVEVLLLQLDPDDPALPAKEKLIRNHLVDLQKNRLPRVARSMGVSIEGLKRLVVEVSLLHPRPGVLHSEESPMRILPDVIVERIDGEYIVRLENHTVPSLRISGLYRKFLQDKSGDREARDYIKKKIESARWIIEAITQRQNTLYRVACAIIEIQRPFLDHGITRMSPLKMQTIADSLEIHVSTVSRAVSGKYVQTHRGIFPLKYFFTGGTARASGKDLSRATVKMRVQEIIGNEDRFHPLSDEEVGKALQREGLNVARRTVTKYRKMLNIPSSRGRKEF